MAKGPSGAAVLGTRLGSGKEVTLSGPTLMAHKLVIGVTGSGKSKLLASLIVQLINLGVACLVLDPHSDLIEDILAFLVDTGYYTNPAAFRRVQYLSFKGDRGRHVPFNVLRQARLSAHDTARFIWEACTRAWSSLDGGAAPLMEQVILSGALALIQADLPLTMLSPLLTDAAVRTSVLQRVSDPMVLDFFRRLEESGKRAGMLSESALRRAYLLSFAPALRYTLGQPDNLLDLRASMDAGVSLLCDLGGLDEETQRMLGCLLTVSAETAALSRADVPESARRAYCVVLDEWSMFASQSDVALERMLALVRKYGVSITLACQSLGQARKLQSALQNCLPVVLRLGFIDADWGASVVGSYDPHEVKTTARGSAVYTSRSEQQAEWADRLRSLPPRHGVVKLGQETVPFYTLGLPQTRVSRGQLAAVKERYAQLLLRAPDARGMTLPPQPPQPARDGGADGGAQHERPGRVRRREWVDGDDH